MAIKNYLTIYPEDKNDYHKVGMAIRECLIFLYEQWHELSRQRYLEIKKIMIAKGMVTE